MTFLSYEYSSLNSGQWLPGIFCLKIFWLCSLFVHLDIQKNTSTLSFFYISVFTMHGNGFGRSSYIPKHSFLLTEIHIRMHVCTKKFFLALISLHLLYIKLKLESFLLFYAYIECTSMHRMKNLC